ncbi:MAG: prepilin-type N-terminal cleavage/methylation domain-containing protein, partial [Sulfurospirillaceae bacterium]|nr:prepilin-type N-terminal cleavage/methylation domain-containing protein [Sulfurospirillaceae bacterium]
RRKHFCQKSLVMKKAFTMLELVMVMVIMGIVASIGAEIIASMYSNYLRSRTINRLESQTEITLEQIAKRLQYRIKESVITRNNLGNPLSLSDSSIAAGGTFNVLEWIGASNESFLGTPRPGWSGFIDLDSNDTNRNAVPRPTLKTSESNLTDAISTISALTNGNITLTATNEAALVFKGMAYSVADFGWGNPNNFDGTATIKVRTGASIDILEISNDANPPTEITEQYTLAHTAYAIVPSATNSTDFNLTLYYNYQPWLGRNYNAHGKPSVLAEHVSLFRFRQDESILRLKLCLHDANQTGVGDLIVVCKEKVVY